MKKELFPIIAIIGFVVIIVFAILFVGTR